MWSVSVGFEVRGAGHHQPRTGLASKFEVGTVDVGQAKNSKKFCPSRFFKKAPLYDRLGRGRTVTRPLEPRHQPRLALQASASQPHRTPQVLSLFRDPAATAPIASSSSSCQNQTPPPVAKKPPPPNPQTTPPFRDYPFHVHLPLNLLLLLHRVASSSIFFSFPTTFLDLNIRHSQTPNIFLPLHLSVQGSETHSPILSFSFVCRIACRLVASPLRS